MRIQRLSFVIWAVLLLSAAPHVLGDTANKPVAKEKTVELPALRVVGDPVEDFGFRVSPVFDSSRSSGLLRTFTPVVDMVLPNTAASKAGLRPGDRIVLADNMPTGSHSRALREWQRLQKKKWAEIESGATGILWTLVVESVWAKGDTRFVRLELPTAAPHWGATIWQTPPDRKPVRVPEPGPLATRAEEILNNGIWMILRETYQKGFDLPTDAANPSFLCFQWTLWDERGGHRMWVSRQRGRTDIIIEAIVRSNNQSVFGGTTPSRTPDQTLASVVTTLATSGVAYLTSPSGRLEKAVKLGQETELPIDAATAGFHAEMDFWLNQVGKTSPLWPLGVIEPATVRR
ncbi:hypothetical protein ESB00_13875 [Oleiharenicola lentus]|uniref:PDZ domain-containing protein n=1 Tax=Oleiharenicola lentus TaxID=2508720 RepID=A0A4Q1C3L1_9BACT|nr:hypothetical protein ESB00_13875 [Oleiharenicola lentus]